MKICEIFSSFQGEGLYSGAICIFVRFAGCSLHCSICDTLYSWSDKDCLDVGVPNIIDKILEIDHNPRHICITGGEPLEQPKVEMFNLLQVLQSWYGARGLESIVIETNGSQDVSWLLNKPFRKIVSLSVDYKLPCTGREDKMLFSNFTKLEQRDVIKFICKDFLDIEAAKTFLLKLAPYQESRPVVLFHALGGKAEDWLADQVLKLPPDLIHRFGVRVGIQLHKIFHVK